MRLLLIAMYLHTAYQQWRQVRRWRNHWHQDIIALGKAHFLSSWVLTHGKQTSSPFITASRPLPLQKNIMYKDASVAVDVNFATPVDDIQVYEFDNTVAT